MLHHPSRNVFRISEGPVASEFYPAAVFLVSAARHDLHRIIRQRSLQRLRLIPGARIQPSRSSSIVRITLQVSNQRLIIGLLSAGGRSTNAAFSVSMSSGSDSRPSPMAWQRGKQSRGNDVAKAMDYMLKRWTAFTRFLDDGSICISNNAAERGVRGIALGRNLGCSADPIAAARGPQRCTG
jgi:hypothetical protein